MNQHCVFWEFGCERASLQERDESTDSHMYRSALCCSGVWEFAKISGEVGEERNVKCQLLSVAEYCSSAAQ